MSSTTSPIPGFYRIFFTTFDPFLSATGIATCLFLPKVFLKSFMSNPTISTETQASLDVSAAFFAGCLFTQLYLLRIKSHDVAVWKAVQGTLLIQDIIILGAFVRVASAQGRLALEDWTLFEWSNNAILAGLAATRAAFIMGIGFSKGKGKAT